MPRVQLSGKTRQAYEYLLSLAPSDQGDFTLERVSAILAEQFGHKGLGYFGALKKKRLLVEVAGGEGSTKKFKVKRISLEAADAPQQRRTGPRKAAKKKVARKKVAKKISRKTGVRRKAGVVEQPMALPADDAGLIQQLVEHRRALKRLAEQLQLLGLEVVVDIRLNLAD